MIASTLAKGSLAAMLALTAPGVAMAVPHAGAAARGLSTNSVSMGCGIGRTRDAMGRCRHRFNLFDTHEHRRFRTFRKKHCATVETPNGRVRRCRI